MSCAPFQFFKYILIENGMMGFISLCDIFARFKVLFQARIVWYLIVSIPDLCTISYLDSTIPKYLHCHCESLNEPLHLRCCS